MPTDAPVSTTEPHKKTKPVPSARGEEIRAKREAEKAERKAKGIALQACLVPFLVLVVVAIAFSVMNRPNIVVGLINLTIILYSSFCTVRTWINISQKCRGLWFMAIIATVINLPLLGLVGLMVARLLSGR